MVTKIKIENQGLILDVVITQEKIKGKTYYVAQGIQLDVASQGMSLNEALENIKEAAEIVLENKNNKIDLIKTESQNVAPMLTRIFL